MRYFLRLITNTHLQGCIDAKQVGLIGLIIQDEAQDILLTLQAAGVPESCTMIITEVSREGNGYEYFLVDGLPYGFDRGVPCIK